jgi:translocator protein
MNSNKTLLIGNILALVVVLTMNALANILPINGMNTGQISDLYPSLFTPAGFTFSIWSIIYLLQIGFAIAQFRIRDKPYFKELSLWFCLSCFANASWILVWHYLFTGASVIVMLILLFSLVQIFLLLQQAQSMSKTEWFFIKLPFIFYFAWICVATIANVSALLVSLNWHGGFLTEEHWAVVMISIAAFLGLFVAFKFEEPAFLVVLIWAFFGIYNRWIETEHTIIMSASRIAGIVLALMLGKLLVDKRKKVATL